MRQMVLNHASVYAPDVERRAILDWLVDLARGISELVRSKVVESAWRMRKTPEFIPCCENYSLMNALLELQRGKYREESRILLRLSTKTPEWTAAGAEVEGKFLLCRHQSLPADQGEPLVLCAIANWVAVGLPSQPIWDQNWLSVEFEELLPDETWNPVSERIDNLTRSDHAATIRQQHQERLARGADPSSFWARRIEAFPALLFGPGVEQNLRDQANKFSTIVGKLIDLNQAAAEWKNAGGAAPDWPTKVTDEANLKPRLLELRRFPSDHGTSELFTWHARFGSGGRIHLRFDATIREVEIGYIGPHLPL